MRIWQLHRPEDLANIYLYTHLITMEPIPECSIAELFVWFTVMMMMMILLQLPHLLSMMMKIPPGHCYCSWEYGYCWLDTQICIDSTTICRLQWLVRPSIRLVFVGWRIVASVEMRSFVRSLDMNYMCGLHRTTPTTPFGENDETKLATTTTITIAASRSHIWKIHTPAIVV